MRHGYYTDLTDQQWEILKPIVDISNERGKPREINMREVINAIAYIGKTFAQWPLLPNDFLPKSTDHYYFSKFRDDGTCVDVTSPDSLPENAKAYLERISQYLDLPILIVSVGPKRSQTVI